TTKQESGVALLTLAVVKIKKNDGKLGISKMCLVFLGVVAGAATRPDDVGWPQIQKFAITAISIVFEAARLVFLQKYMRESKRNFVTALSYLALVCAAVNAFAYAVFEHSRFESEFFSRIGSSKIIISCSITILANVSAAFLVSHSYSLALNIFSVFKWILLIIAFVILNEETKSTIGYLQIIWFGTALICLIWRQVSTIQTHKLVFSLIILIFVPTFSLMLSHQNLVKSNAVFAQRVLTVDEFSPAYQALTYKYYPTIQEHDNASTRNYAKNYSINYSTMDIVISYYNENIQNLHHNLVNLMAIPAVWNRCPRVIVYVKGDEINLQYLQNATNASEIHVVSNIGREGHTYLRHIYERYNGKEGGLADYTLFLQGSPESFVPARLREGLEEGYTFRGQFLVSKSRVKRNKLGAYKKLLDMLEAGIADNIHKEAMFPWFQQQFKKSTPENPAFGHTLERSWDKETGFKGKMSRFDNIAMSHDSCRNSFPKLYYEVDRSWKFYKKRGISKSDLDALANEQNLRIVIKKNKLYIKAFENGFHTRTKAVAAAIHEAIMMSPEPIPDCEFVITTEDKGTGRPGLWALTRHNTDEMTWLYPDFGFFAWPEVGVDSYEGIREKAFEVETEIHSKKKKKIEKLLWRGAALTDSRKILLSMKDQEWADFQELNWRCIEQHNFDEHCKNHVDVKSIPDHCNYKFLMQTEGMTYSGRMK
ncbi:hypothetical protein HK100_003053, partial [Physocladia obscura]